MGPARLAEILGVELLRSCDRKSKANPMFFTLGARQVGRAAADGWKHVIRPALEEVSLWPFDGALVDLLARPGLVLAEIYPALFFGKVRMGEGKEAAEARRRVFGELLEKARSEGGDPEGSTSHRPGRLRAFSGWLELFRPAGVRR